MAELGNYRDLLDKIDRERDPFFGVSTTMDIMIDINKKIKEILLELESLNTRIEVLENATTEEP